MDSTKWFSVLVLSNAIILSGCGSPMATDPKNVSSSNGSYSEANPLDGQVKLILQNNCASCHGETDGPAGIYGLTNPQHLLDTGLVVKGQPTQSPLVTAVATTMPPSGPLSAQDQAIIQNWILAMNDVSAPAPTPAPAPGPAPAPAPAPTPPPAVVTFKFLQSTIFQPKCVGCHSSNSAAAGYAFDTYTKVMKAVKVASPTASRVYASTKSGSMPRGSAKLTSAQLDQLLSWIKAGAPNN